jgi:C-terminal processing protease CtpA/Prc
MFAEVWRTVRDEYAVESLPHVAWTDVYAQYAALLPKVGTRDELSDVIQEMLAELRCSHVWEEAGRDDSAPPEQLPGVLGADFEWCSAAGGYRLVHIVRGDVWDAQRGGPLARPGAVMKVGDVLVAVDGRSLGPDWPPERSLIGCALQEVQLAWLPEVEALAAQLGADLVLEDESWMEAEPSKVELVGKKGKQKKVKGKGGQQVKPGKGQPEVPASVRAGKAGRSARAEREQQDARLAEPISRFQLTRAIALKDDVFARYRDAIVTTRARVHASSGGRCGYLHLPDCERLGFCEFHRRYLQESRRGALIVDVRSNAGGQVCVLVQKFHSPAAGLVNFPVVCAAEQISELVLQHLAQRSAPPCHPSLVPTKHPNETRVQTHCTLYIPVVTVILQLCTTLGYEFPRWGQPEPYPSTAPAGPVVLLTDEMAGSDGDLISHRRAPPRQPAEPGPRAR